MAPACPATTTAISVEPVEGSRCPARLLARTLDGTGSRTPAPPLGRPSSCGTICGVPVCPVGRASAAITDPVLDFAVVTTRPSPGTSRPTRSASTVRPTHAYGATAAASSGATPTPRARQASTSATTSSNASTVAACATTCSPHRRGRIFRTYRHVFTCAVGTGFSREAFGYALKDASIFRATCKASAATCTASDASTPSR